MDIKVAAITGGGSGIGQAVALGLAEAGYAIVVAGRRQEPLEETAREASKSGRQALAVVADITDPASVRSLFDKVHATYGRLDLLFNNAGLAPPTVPIDELSDEQWKVVVDTNLTGTFLCTREAIKLMKSQRPRGGRIINNGSISAQSPRPGSAPYTATKHAVTGLTKSTALDCRGWDIACGQIDIGNAESDLTKEFATGTIQASGETAVEPTIDTKHVVDALLYMASLPLDANVLFMTLMATKMPFVGRG